MKIIIDAMGGDNAPDEIVLGTADVTTTSDIEAILVGKTEEILRAFERLGIKDIPKGIEIVNASEVIEIDEDPASAIRTKKDSSLTVGLTLLRDGKGDGFVSAGSSGCSCSIRFCCFV